MKKNTLVLFMFFLLLGNSFSFASNIEGDSVVIEAKYNANKDNSKLSNLIYVDYRCVRNNLPLTDIFTLYLNNKRNPISIRMSSKGNPSTHNVKINYEERINFIRLMLQNIAKDYSISYLSQIFINPSDFGDAFILINKEIAKIKGPTNDAISSLFKASNNIILSDISKILAGFNLSIKDVIIEDEVLKYSRDEYIKNFHYSGNDNTLPFVFYEPIRILLVINSNK